MEQGRRHNGYQLFSPLFIMKTNYEISVEGFMTRDIQERHPLKNISDPIELIKTLVEIAQDTKIIPVYRLRAIEFQGNLFLKGKVDK